MSAACPSTSASIHFVGIGGIGMSGIAEVLHNLGYQVQGSDIADSANVQAPARARHPGRDRPRAENLADAAVVVISSAVKPDNPEVDRRARQRCCRWCAAPRCWPS